MRRFLPPLTLLLAVEGTYGVLGIFVFAVQQYSTFGFFFDQGHIPHERAFLFVGLVSLCLLILVVCGVRLFQAVRQGQWNVARLCLSGAIFGMVVLAMAWSDIVVGVLVASYGVYALTVGTLSSLHVTAGDWLATLALAAFMWAYPAIFMHAVYLRFVYVPRKLQEIG